MNPLVKIGITAFVALAAASSITTAASALEATAFVADLSHAWLSLPATGLLRVKLDCDFKHGRLVCGEKKGGNKSSHNDDEEHNKKKKDKPSKSTQSGNSGSPSDKGSKGVETTTTPNSNKCGGNATDNVLWGDYCYVDQ